MIDGKNFFDQPVKIDVRIYDNILNIANGWEDDYTTSFFARSCLSQRL